MLRHRAAGLVGWQFWLLNGFASIVLILGLVNISLYSGNQDLKAEVEKGQRFLNESLKVSQLNSQLIQSLANISARTGDVGIRNLLASHGITFRMPPKTSTEKKQANKGSLSSGNHSKKKRSKTRHSKRKNSGK